MQSTSERPPPPPRRFELPVPRRERQRRLLATPSRAWDQPPTESAAPVRAAPRRYTYAYVFRYENMRNNTLKELRETLHGSAR